MCLAVLQYSKNDVCAQEKSGIPGLRGFVVMKPTIVEQESEPWEEIAVRSCASIWYQPRRSKFDLVGRRGPDPNATLPRRDGGLGFLEVQRMRRLFGPVSFLLMLPSNGISSRTLRPANMRSWIVAACAMLFILWSNSTQSAQEVPPSYVRSVSPAAEACPAHAPLVSGAARLAQGAVYIYTDYNAPTVGRCLGRPVYLRNTTSSSRRVTVRVSRPRSPGNCERVTEDREYTVSANDQVFLGYNAASCGDAISPSCRNVDYRLV